MNTAQTKEYAVRLTHQSVEEEMTPQDQAELEAQVEAIGHKYYGIFADDPGTMEVFDVIQRVRDQDTTGGNRYTVRGSICVN
jgi:hypothetical protein